jgi:two-component system, cell cycle sensor histidine kinase and response regulator CckA
VEQVTGELVVQVRRRVLGVLRWLTTLAALILAGLWVQALRLGRPTGLLGLELGVMAILAAALWIDRERRIATSAALVCGLLFAVNVIAFLQFGPMMGTGTMFLGWVAGVVFFFERAALPSTIVSAKVLALGWATHSGVLPVAWAPLPDGLAAWARITFAVGTCSFAIGFVFLRLIESHRRALQLEQVARSREAAAHAEREQAQRKLAASARLDLIGRLAGEMAHDFNNTLMALRGSFELLQTTEHVEGRGALRGEIERALSQGSRTTRQLLAFAKQGSDPAGESSPRETVQLLCQSLQRILPEPIALKTELYECGPLRLSSATLQRALLELCLEARDRMPNGGVVEVGLRPDGDLRVGLEVRCSADSAMTVPDDLLALLAPSDVTVGPTEDRRGVRLSMARAPDRPREASEPSAPSPRALRILVLEDEPQVQRTILRILERAAHEVTVTATVSEAQAALDARDDFELLLADARLPDGSSGPVVERFRAADPRRPIILCSGYVDGDALLDGLADRGLTFLQKPFTGKQLLAEIAAAVSASPAGDASPKPLGGR